MELNFINIKENSPEEGKHVLIWTGMYFYVGEILYVENGNPCFLCGGIVVDDAISFAYLPDQPERLNPEDDESRMR